MDVLEKPGSDPGVMLSTRKCFKAFPSSVAEIDHANDAHDGVTTSFPLSGGLRVALLVLHGIKKLQRASINGLERQSAPLVALNHPGIQGGGGLVGYGLQEAHRHSGASISVGGGIAGGLGQSLGDVPGLHHAHGPGAGGIEFKDLAEPGPEGWNGSVMALPLGLIDLTEKIALENGLKKQSVATEGITDELFSGSLNRGLNFSLGGGKYGRRKAGQ